MNSNTMGLVATTATVVALAVGVGASVSSKAQIAQPATPSAEHDCAVTTLRSPAAAALHGGVRAAIQDCVAKGDLALDAGH